MLGRNIHCELGGLGGWGAGTVKLEMKERRNVGTSHRNIRLLRLSRSSPQWLKLD